MISGQTALTMVQTKLCQQLDALLGSLPHLRLEQFLGELDSIRRIATDYSLEPVRLLAGNLEARLAHGQQLQVVMSCMELMREAASCGRTDRSTAEAFAAAVSLRLDG